MASYYASSESSKGRRRSSPPRYYTTTSAPKPYRYGADAIVYPEDTSNRRNQESKSYSNYDYHGYDRPGEQRKQRRVGGEGNGDGDGNGGAAVDSYRGRRKSILKHAGRVAEGEVRGAVRRLRSKSRARFRDDASVIDDDDDANRDLEPQTRSRGRTSQRPTHNLVRSRSHRRNHDDDEDGHELERKTSNWNKLFRDKRSVYENEEARALRRAARSRERTQYGQSGGTGRGSRRQRNASLSDDDEDSRLTRYIDGSPNHRRRRRSSGADHPHFPTYGSHAERPRHARNYRGEGDLPPYGAVAAARTRSRDRGYVLGRNNYSKYSGHGYGADSGERIYWKGKEGLVDAMKKLRT